MSGVTDVAGRGTGSGKLILFGEHTVVYGTPAIVAGLPDGAIAEARYSEGGEASIELDIVDETEPSPAHQRTLQKAFEAIVGVFEDVLDGPPAVSVSIDIPVGVGLGSSAALSAAVSRSLADLSGAGGRVEFGVEAGEDVFHGAPSGIDQLAALRGGLHLFHPGEPDERAPIQAESFRLGVCVAGPPASTADMVERVAGRRDREPELFEYLKLLVGDATRFGARALREGNRRRVGELMDVDHGALSSLGVSTAELDEAVHTARRAGALGAKLTGAGGGGCVVALLPDREGGEVLDAWRREGWEAFEVEIE